MIKEFAGTYKSFDKVYYNQWKVLCSTAFLSSPFSRKNHHAVDARRPTVYSKVHSCGPTWSAGRVGGGKS